MNNLLTKYLFAYGLKSHFRSFVGIFSSRLKISNLKQSFRNKGLVPLLSVVILTAACLTLSSLALAAHPLATDDAGTQGMLKLQVETSAEFGWDRETEHGIATKSAYQRLNVAVTAGVLDSLDLALCLPYTWQKIEYTSGSRIDNSGLNDLSLALKWRIGELGPVSLAIKPAITFPNGNRERSLGVGQVAYGATLISTVEFKPLLLHTNVG